MAKINKKLNYIALPASIKRGNASPLDTTFLWNDYSLMKEYASSGDTAYVGQLLTLVNEEDKTSTLYIIEDENGSLRELEKKRLNSEETFSLTDNTINLKNWGVQYYIWDENSQEYVIQKVDHSHSWIAGLEPKVSKKEDGSFELAWYQPLKNNATNELMRNFSLNKEEFLPLEGGEMTGDIILKDGSPAISEKIFNSKISSFKKMNREIVAWLPEIEDAEINTIYMVRNTAGTYNEYLLIDGQFQLIGDTSIDLSNYIEKVDESIPYNFAVFTQDGKIKDGLLNASDFVSSSHLDDMSKHISKKERDIWNMKRILNTALDICSIENPREGEILETLGYYKVGDGGEAKYLIKEREECDIDEFINISINNSSLVACLFSHSVNALQCGIKRDETPQEAFFYHNAFKNFKSIFFPKGKYVISETITVPNGSSIIGESTAETIFIPAKNFKSPNQILFYFPVEEFQLGTIKNFSCQNLNYSINENCSLTAIQIGEDNNSKKINAKNFELLNLEFSLFFNGIICHNKLQFSNFNNLSFDSGKLALLMKGDNISVSNVFVDKQDIIIQSENSIYDRIKIKEGNFYFEGSYNSLLQTDILNCSEIVFKNASNTNMNNVKCVGGSPIKIQGLMSGTKFDLRIINCLKQINSTFQQYIEQSRNFGLIICENCVGDFKSSLFFKSYYGRYEEIFTIS